MIYLLGYLRENGFDVRINYFGKEVKLFIADYCWFKDKYNERIIQHKKKHNSKIIHRIDGLLSAYRNDGNKLDIKAKKTNEIAFNNRCRNRTSF